MLQQETIILVVETLRQIYFIVALTDVCSRRVSAWVTLAAFRNMMQYMAYLIQMYKYIRVYKQHVYKCIYIYIYKCSYEYNW